MSTSSPGDPELRVEAADRLEARLPEGHVAAGDVLGDLVGQQHVDRPAGRVGDALGGRPSSGGGMLGPPMPTCELFRKAVARCAQPVRVGQASASM